MRNALTSLVTHGFVKTTPKRARALVAYTDSFFAYLAKLHDRLGNDTDVRREAIRYTKSVIYTSDAWKKIVDEHLSTLKGRTKAWYTKQYKLWARKGDATEEIHVELAI